MSLERPHSRASSGSRGPPPTPPPTYLWEEVRRNRSKGGYPWTILEKPPLPDHFDIEQLLRGEIKSEDFLKGNSNYGTDRRTYRNRAQDRERCRRARSEPTPSLLDSNTVSESAMDQASSVDPSMRSDELDDFPLPDEDIPDFVMAYLQSDKGNLDEDIPDHILEYIQSRAAILERDQQHTNQADDDIFYTKDEIRIMDQTRKRLEEQGELNPDLSGQPPSDFVEDADAFDQFFQRATLSQETASALPEESNKRKKQDQPKTDEPNLDSQKPKKAGKFNFKNISMPNKPQLNIKLPKFGQNRKKPNDVEDVGMGSGIDVAQSGKKVKQRRTQSASPMRHKINQQLESWNNSLKKFKMPSSNRNQDNQVKSFVALLPGRSRKPTKKKEPENQYEEVGLQRDSAVELQRSMATKQDNSILKATAENAEMNASNRDNQDEETMEDIENLPESEEADAAKDIVIADREVADVIVNQGEFYDINIDSNKFEENNEIVDQTDQAADKTNAPTEPAGFAARSKKAFELTKSKIQSSLSKEQLQATRNKLHTTLSKQNLQATRKKMKSSLSKQNLQATRDKLQSTLSKKNFEATRNKLQTSLNSTLKRGKNVKPEPLSLEGNIFLDSYQDGGREYETSTPVERKTTYQDRVKNSADEEDQTDTNPPTAKRRAKKSAHSTSKASLQSSQLNECANIQEETEEDLEDELEPKLEFSLHGSERQRPSSVSQSTETLPEESDKENVVVRPKRTRYRHRRHGFHEEFARPQSAHFEPNIRSSWTEKTVTHPAISQEVLSTFCAPINSLDGVNSHWASMRKPERPSRSRSKRELNSSENHIYSNVPPRRTKHGKKQVLSEHQSDIQTWPRRSLTAVRPVTPKRKSKMANKPTYSVGSNYQTWPKRSLVQSPPIAPRRSRSKAQMNSESTVDLESQIIGDQINNNILIDADTLFGAESRFIDEEGIDMEEVRANREHVTAINNSELEHNIPSEPSRIDKILNTSSPKPVVPRRQKNPTSSLRKTKRAVVQSNGEMTWPRSKVQPSVPYRRKLSTKKKETAETGSYLELEKPSKKIPVVPSSSPSEGHEINNLTEGETNATSIQAGLDQILEILASTFLQETNPTEDNNKNEKEELPFAVPTIENQERESIQVQEESNDNLDENPYAEIKQFQRRTPPPRPPPPSYAPASSSSYSYIYTVPRRKKGTNSSISPERPPRTYCTIRPHRPPRRSRSRTQEVPAQLTESVEFNLARRHSFSIGDQDTNKEERDLQAAPIVERMRARPLPAPPRSKSSPLKPPRSRTSSLRRPKPHQPDDISVPQEVETQIVTENIANSINVAVDEYEPIENPVQVEEISIGIQTDPVPEYEESVTMMESNEVQHDIQQDELAEINNNSRLVYERVEETVTQSLEPQPVETANDVEPTTTEQEEVCTQMTWSAANSPDPEPDFQMSSPDQESNKVAEPVETVQNESDDGRRKSSLKETNVAVVHGDEDADSYSQIPPSFYRSIAPPPPIQIEFPTRLQLSELDVERLNVREVTADRLIVSSVDTNSLQVCQMTTSNTAGQLVFNIGPGVTIPFLADQRNSRDEGQTNEPAREIAPTVNPISNTAAEIVEEEIQNYIEPSPSVPPVCEPEPAAVQETQLRPKTTTAGAEESHSTQENSNNATPVPTLGQTEDPTFSDLAMQLATLSTRHLITGACAAVSETYTMAQRVAELGLRQLNEQLQRRGIHFDDSEKQDLKAVLLMLLIVVSAIFLLGMGKQRISNHWDFYFPH